MKKIYDSDYFYSLVGRNLQEEYDDVKLGNSKNLNSQKKTRICNRCEKEFTSNHKGHRRCPNCHHEILKKKINTSEKYS